MAFFILQTAAVTDTVATQAGQGGIRLLDLLLKGGFFMIPILILSIIAVYIFFERLFAFKTANQDPDHIIDSVEEHMHAGNLNAALAACQQHETPVARVLEKGLKRIGKEVKYIESAMENEAQLELFKLEKRLPLLATIAGVAPMVGFLGTVTGMIKAFYDLSANAEGGVVDSGLLAGGIYEAMVTTAAGLTVGIIAYVAYNLLVAQLNKITYTMEYSSNQFLDILQEPA